MLCCYQKLLTLDCPLVNVLINIRANVKDAWEYVGSDSYIERMLKRALTLRCASVLLSGGIQY